jgi:adenosyl cobinamide kinase/adenosyl cobinamide phosphate guanylyltransferase
MSELAELTQFTGEDLFLFFAIDRQSEKIKQEIVDRISLHGKVREQDYQMIEDIAEILKTMEETDSDLLSMSIRQREMAEKVIGLKKQLLRRMRGKVSRKKHQQA